MQNSLNSSNILTRSLLCFIIGITMCHLYAQHQELGEVLWLRNFDEALDLATKEQKDVFLLFQEVPGCTTCKNYGKNVLSHPLIVELIESEFIPLAIFNNKGGKDKDVLDFYKEPSWNNPVVRIIDENKGNVVNRLSGNYTMLGVLEIIEESLQVREKSIPVYLSLLLEEYAAIEKEACYSMYCFWSGEAHFGSQDGIISTKAGFQNGREVVQVTYDEKIWNQKKLDLFASKANCSPEKDGAFREDKEIKYYLYNHALRGVSMTSVQQTRVNAALKHGEDPLSYLSNRQILTYVNLQSEPLSKIENQIGKNL